MSDQLTRHAEWTDEVAHKYCGKLDAGRKGKPNKVQHCEKCMAIKGRQLQAEGGDGKHRRREKMSWLTGSGGEGGM